MIRVKWTNEDKEHTGIVVSWVSDRPGCIYAIVVRNDGVLE